MLVTPERRPEDISGVVVHPDHAYVDGADGAVGLQLVLGVDYGGQAVVAGVGDPDGVFVSVEGRYGG